MLRHDFGSEQVQQVLFSKRIVLETKYCGVQFMNKGYKKMLETRWSLTFQVH